MKQSSRASKTKRVGIPAPGQNMNKPPLLPMGKKNAEADQRAKQTIISMNLASGSIQEFDMDQSQLWSE